jgi:hypothetical protein
MRKSIRIFSMLLLLFLIGGEAFAINGAVTVSYELSRKKGIASNQIAVWIEDAKGNFVKTLFATDYMAKRKGFKARPMLCPDWVKAADLQNLSQPQIDAVSGPTQKPGEVSLKWDCTDAKGNPVAPGAYVYKVEGNIFWENRVLWTGKIRIGEKPDYSTAAAVYTPETAREKGQILADVAARYMPEN